MLYILVMIRKMEGIQEEVLKMLSGKINDFYIAGGTALSLFYFHHRQSEDLDFFSRQFNKARVLEIIQWLSQVSKKECVLVKQGGGKKKAQILVYLMSINKKTSLKIDFVQDYIKLIKPLKSINGINVLSLEDIYIRKICAIAGTFSTQDLIGRPILTGGRQEAKDFYDLYCLSSIFTRLSDFAFKYCGQIMREGIINWFRSYSRLDMKTGLLDLQIAKDINYAKIEQHFKKEISKILEKEVDFI